MNGELPADGVLRRGVWLELMDYLREQHVFLDMLTRSWTTDYAGSGGRIFCKRGCRGCCNLAVNVTFTEAVAITGTLTEKQSEAVRLHVGRLRERINDITDMKGYLRMYRREIGFCPLLAEDGSCGVYVMRPLTCRALLSIQESRWCEADFAELTSHEKNEFVESLDRAVVAFPMHYVASMQEAGREMEIVAGRRMIELFGFSLYGTLPVLIHLAQDHGLADACAEGYDAVARILTATGLNHPFMLHVES